MLESTKIKINGEEYLVKKSYRSLMLFEEKASKSVSKIKETVNDLLLLFWCVLSANNRDKFQFTFDEFIDVIDDNPEAMDLFNEYLISQIPKNYKSSAEKKTTNQ